ncbi:peptide ligase PGM1-related protein [Dictyobacter arantiisoli]|uniref:ATP-grasp domain-containing protein n=1 Tax=Dictyobacter arantiisoli TaxID=2014874 RepID=A0A5A5TFL0_9CHLR|nr:peptide ligase PGM1-related protein [Dictyobacter arantiisoli]GCF10360.1 hypothetical protein KDI_39240 [Dictyobacter arantiisoli]
MLKLLGTQPRLIIGNVVSDAVMDQPDDDYVQRMEAGMPRKVWTMREGDILITSVAVPAHMKQYACQTLGLNPDNIVCLTPAQRLSYFLTENILADQTLMQELRQLIQSRPGIEYYPFLLDNYAMALAQELHIPISLYGGLYAEDIQKKAIVENIIYQMNRKSHFRNTMVELGAHVARGHVVTSPQTFIQVATDHLKSSTKIIIKRDRGSNGYGHTVIDRNDPDVNSQIQHFASEMLSVPYIVEDFLAQRWAPSIELAVANDGPHLLYPCDQRCLNNSWVGMSIPPLDLPASLHTAITNAAFSFGKYLYQAGYRGVFDVDGVANEVGNWIVTETNLRTTGGTHMHIILTRLLGEDYLTHYWTLAESIRTNNTSFATLFEKMEQAQIAFRPEKQEGVIITADGTLTDGKFRYILFAHNVERALQIEDILRNLL